MNRTARHRRIGPPRPHGRRAYTLVELLVSTAVIAVLIGMMLPALAAVRSTARAAVCRSNLRQLVTAWTLYSDAYSSRVMPLADDRASQSADDVTYWWGTLTLDGPQARVDHTTALIAPFFDSELGERSVFECPAQPWGTYRAQPIAVPAPGAPTSTYGYNGYYLSPGATPGWSLQIGKQRWKRLSEIDRPAELFVFADTMLPASILRNCALLDPPRLFTQGMGWSKNLSPTTSFRHGTGCGTTNTARADGSVLPVRAIKDWQTHPELRIGSVGTRNDPYYVPDWKAWK